MESLRQKKVARLLQKDLGNYFQQEATHFVPGGLLTVTQVRVTPDLALAKVYLSVFPSEKASAALQLVEEHGKAIRFYLGKNTRHQLRVIPELQFYLDDSLDYAERIDQLLNE